MIAFGAFVLLALALLYVVLPQLGGVRHTWDRLNNGNAWWIGVAAALEIGSIASYVAIFHGVHVPPGSPLTRRDSYRITLAGLAATRIFAAGGAGGVALTAWALRRSGMGRREVATRMVAFLVLVYGVYVGAMVLCGVLLYAGLLGGPHPFAITIGPAILGAVVIAIVCLLAVLPASVRKRVDEAAARLHVSPGDVGAPGAAQPAVHSGSRRASGRSMRLRRRARRLVAAPGLLVGGVRFAASKLRHPDLALLGAVCWWALNIGVLYASFRAFGKAPPVGVVVQAYLVGMLANLLPLPGGIGGVDGGMIGAAVALGVGGSVALIAVLTYRLFAFWLPTLPGALAYLQLRRSVNRWGATEAPNAADGLGAGAVPAVAGPAMGPAFSEAAMGDPAAVAPAPTVRALYYKK
jgi:uncharacterized membrane protein YbhN (UPF0104 family)